MTKKICAVTVSNNCIERNKYSIKYLIVGIRKTGEPFWFVRHVGETGFNIAVLEGKAIQYAITHFTPFIPNVKHGQNIKEWDIERLKNYGVAV